MLKKGLKLAHWVWTISTLTIAGFWFIHHGGTTWFPVSVPVVNKAVAASVDTETSSSSVSKVVSTTVQTVDEVGVEIMNSSTVSTALHADAISIAYQLGRLDFASLALALIGVVFAILGVFGFMHLKDRAEFIAKKTTEECFEQFKKEMSEKLEQDAIKYMEESVPDLFQDYAELYKNGVVNTNETSGTEDDIAPAPDEDLRGGHHDEK
ncbi:hypothetical protein [Marinomonas ostreistagni]|uniref:hypothetical protein n=1 Tax=Marinomonas ostreistagni TaxID=359209 RepID=UPI001951FC94|nr:hypothetical protein [Marinomonas ostreistagni]MBM6550697.1 hypothetical protein [Marinomonas ostreistagni]